MSLTGVAALIAAASFAVLACAGVFLAVRFTRILGDAATLVRETRADQQALFARANAAVDRANAQLDSAEAVSASMDELGSSMEELAGQVSALAGFGRTMAGAVVSGPVGRAAAVAYGVRHAVALRRVGRRKLIVRGVSGGSSPLEQAERALPGQLVNGAELPPAGRGRTTGARR
jgi:uncharacterized protein YoxC